MPESKNHADVIIIGSGIIGSSAAYNIAKRGLSVIVLEKESVVGDGGSSRNGGGVRQSGRHPHEMPLAMYAVKNLWPTLSEELGVNVEYCQKGNIRLGKNEADKKVLEALTASAKNLGLDMRMVTGDEARSINPYLSDEVYCAGWCPTDGHANPLMATLGFYKAARARGVRFISNEEVYKIEKIKGAARRVVAKHSSYEASKIILAAGLGSRPIANTIGLDVPMHPVLLEVIVTETTAELFPQMLGTARADFYGHQEENGSFVFGLNSNYEPFAVYEYGAKKKEERVSSASSSAACRNIISYFPALARIKVLRAWSGWMDDCAGHIPVISFVEEAPGLILACGFSGHGFGISPCVGKILSEMAADGAVDPKSGLDISPFRYDRFVVK